jgi:hypothetical protein
MVRRQDALRAAKRSAILCAGFALIGCQSIHALTGMVKQSPDEFTVLAKAPLVIPPDFNLRPPQPGIASRYEEDPAVQAQKLLYPQSALINVASLGDTYSDGEKLLLSKSNALNTNPDIRRIISADAGLEDQGPDFSRKVLFESVIANAEPDTKTVAANPPAPSVQNSGDLAPIAVAQTLTDNTLAGAKLAIASPPAIHRVREKLAATSSIASPPTSLLRSAYDH